MHARVRHTSLGSDGLETFARMRQTLVCALHVARKFVLPGEAVLPTEWAADDMAWEPFRILAMNCCVVSFHVVCALGADSTAVIFAGVDQLSVLVTSLLAEMIFFVAEYLIYRPINNFLFPSTSFNTAGYVL